MKKTSNLYIILVALNILCVIMFSITAIKNYMSDNIGAMILNIVCVLCWIFCAICNSAQLVRIIKKENRDKNNEKD